MGIKMTFIKKLKNKIKEANELIPAYEVSAKLNLPIYSLDTTDELDPNLIKDICLKIMEDPNNRDTSIIDDGLINGWTTSYLDYGNKKHLIFWEMLSPIIKLIENKANKVLPIPVKVNRFWFHVYGKNTEHKWHHHHGPNFKLTKEIGYVGVYYPAATANVSPIQFRNFESEDLSINIKSGQLLFFPEVLLHSVPAKTTDDLRIVLSVSFQREK
jgi:hypothetical protein